MLGAVAWLSFGTFWSRSARVSPDALEERFVPWIRRLREESRLPVPAFARRVLIGDSPYAPVWQQMLQLNISAGRYFLLLGLLRTLVKRWAPRFDLALLGDLVHDDADMWSKRMVAEVAALARIAAEHPDSAAALSASDLVVQVRGLPPEHPFTLALGRFLTRFGHRGPREIDFSTPRWREDATPLLIMVRNQMLHGGSADDNARYARHLVARDELRRVMRSGLARRMIGLLLNRIRYYVTLRENTRHYHSMLFEAIRTRLLAVEHELIRDGRLNCTGDIFYLRWKEVDALRTGRIEAREVSLLVRERRIAHQRETRALPPETFGIRLPRLQASAGADILRGQCACAGEAEGIARIVLRSDQAHALQPGEIMIAPYTDPTWTPLFPSLAGIVVGIGSYLSHAGTIAREYRIPCLVDVKGCIERIKDGQRIRLNASEGYVQLLAGKVDAIPETDGQTDGDDPVPLTNDEARKLALDLVKAYE
jgi:pyruvate,water dikinase